MALPTITIVGLGLVGTSIGLALRQEKADEFDIIGHDRDFGQARAVRKLGAVNKLDWNLVNACEQADMVIVATPLTGVRETLQAIGPYLKAGSVVIDTANLKGPVMDWASQYLPESVSFVGTNPFISPAGQGPDAASAELFRGALWCVAPGATAAEEAVKLVNDMIYLLGARPYFLDPCEHDGLVASVEHLPLLLSTALLRLTFSAPTWKELRKTTGAVFENSTALPTTDADTYRDIMVFNRDNVVRWLDLFLQEMQHLRELITGDDQEALREAFDKAVDARILWLEQRKEGYPDAVTEKAEMPTMGSFLGGFLGIGGLRRSPDEKEKPKKSRR